MLSKKQKSGWAIIFKYLFQYKKEVFFLSFLGVISAIANGSIPFIVGQFFDSILEINAKFSFLNLVLPLWLAFLIVWLAIQILAVSSDWIMYLKRWKLNRSLFNKYITNAFQKLLLLPISFHKDEKQGKVANNINLAAHWFSTIITDVIISLAPQFLSIIVGFVFVLIIKPQAIFILFFGIIIYSFSLFKITKPAGRLQKKQILAYNEAYGKAYGAMSNVESIKHFTAENFLSNSIERKFSKAKLFALDLLGLWGKLDFFQRFLVIATQFSIFIFSVIFIQRGEMTIGDLIALNGYAAMIFGPFVSLGHNWQTIQNGLVSVVEAQKILDLASENYHPKNAIPKWNMKGNIEFKNVTFKYKYGEERLLQNINFQINAGEKVALVGESGVGKSTLINLIGGFYFPSKGNILIDGNDVSNIDLKFLRGNIAYVPQEVLLFNDTILYNLKFAKPNAKKEEIIESAKKAEAHGFIQKFPKGYKSMVGERGIKLSVGQKQRIAIARAILRDPKILILDEPTSALDSKTEKALIGSLKKLMKNRTTIIIAHRLSTVREADKIIVLDKGKIVEIGKHKDLIKKKKGVYREFYELQFMHDDEFISERHYQQKKEKEKRKAKILTFFQKKDTVANDDIERLLDVSDASVTNYLQELEDEGKIKQIGKSGRYVRYRLR